MKRLRHRGVWCSLALTLVFVPSVWSAEEAPSVQRLIQQMASPDLALRRDAAYRLGLLGVEARVALPALIQALNDPDRQVWSSAIATIAALGPEARDAVPVLIENLEPKKKSGGRNRSSGQIVFRAAYALSRIGAPAVPPLIPVLQSEDGLARIGAARALGGIGPAAKESIPALIGNLRRDQPDERREVAEALGLIGKEAVGPLGDALNSGEASLRAGAALALASLGSDARSLAPRVIELAATEKDPNVRVALFAAIPKIGVEPARGVEILLAGVRDENNTVRHGATNAIYVYRAAQAPLVTALTGMLRDPNSAQAERAALVLGRLGSVASPAVDTLLDVSRQRSPTPPAFFEALGRIGPDAIPGILRAVGKENPDSITRDHWSVRSLPVIGGEAVAPLGVALGDKNISVRLLAARGLGELGPVSAPVFSSLAVASSDTDPRVRAAALGALVGTRAQAIAAVAKIEAGFKDPVPLVRVAAANLVVPLGEKARPLAPILLEALGDRDAGVRAAVVDGLAAVGSAAEPAVPRLLEVMPTSDALTRVRIIKVFTGIGPNARAALPEVRKQLQDPDATVRAAAVHAMAKIDDPSARLPVMLTALDDADLGVRRAAVEEIGLLADKARDATGRLTAMLQHEGERDLAFEALRKIGVRSVPDLIVMLGDRDLAVKSFACQRLGRLGAEARDAIPALQAVTTRSGEREETRRQAKDALAKIGPGT